MSREDNLLIPSGFKPGNMPNSLLMQLLESLIILTSLLYYLIMGELTLGLNTILQHFLSIQFDLLPNLVTLKTNLFLEDIG